MGPNILDSGTFVVSWHGFLSFVAVAIAVLLGIRWVTRGDMHLGKLEKELEPVTKRALDSAFRYFRVDYELSLLRAAEEERGETPEDLQTTEERRQVALAELQATVKDLTEDESGARIVAMSRDGAPVAGTDEDLQGLGSRALRREFQSVLAGHENRHVLRVKGEEHLAVAYPVVVDGSVRGLVRVVAPVGDVRSRTIDAAYGIAIWAIVVGIVGSRIVHVVDEWGFYVDNPDQIIAIWKGGIGLWGAILGGLTGGVLGALYYRMPVGKVVDVAALGVLLAMAVGRVGDIINGEHVSRISDIPWGVVWSHPDSLTFRSLGLVATHPAVAYELLYDLLLFFVLWRCVRGRLKPDGMLFAAYVCFYAFGRFFISFYRADRVVLAGLQEAQIICLGVILVTVPLLAFRAHWVSKEAPAPPRSEGVPAPASEG